MSIEHPFDATLLLIGRCPLFLGLAAEECRDVAAGARCRGFRARDVLFNESDPAAALYVLCAGRVKLCLPFPDEHEVVVRLLGPGDLCGWPAVLTDDTYPVSARAVEPGRALAWERGALEELFGRIPTLSRNALRILARRIREQQERYLELATERVPQRLARTLLRLISPSGRRFEDGLHADVPLSRAELAQMTGTSLFTVSRLLSEWEGQGIVKALRGRVVVERPGRLGRIAEERAPGARDEA